MFCYTLLFPSLGQFNIELWPMLMSLNYSHFISLHKRTVDFHSVLLYAIILKSSYLISFSLTFSHRLLASFKISLSVLCMHIYSYTFLQMHEQSPMHIKMLFMFQYSLFSTCFPFSLFINMHQGLSSCTVLVYYFQ